MVGGIVMCSVRSSSKNTLVWFRKHSPTSSMVTWCLVLSFCRTAGLTIRRIDYTSIILALYVQQIAKKNKTYPKSRSRSGQPALDYKIQITKTLTSSGFQETMNHNIYYQNRSKTLSKKPNLSPQENSVTLLRNMAEYQLAQALPPSLNLAENKVFVEAGYSSALSMPF